MTCRARSLWPSEPHQVGNDLGEAPLSRVQVEREGGQLVDDGTRSGIRREVDIEQIVPARVAGFDANVGKEGLVFDSAFVAKLALEPTHNAAAFARRRPLFAEDREA